MDTEQRERIFEQALQDFRAGRLASATKSLGYLVQDGSRDPAHVSYYGLLLAFTHGRNEESISLCEEAVEKNGRRSSVLYLNLGRALAAHGRRREAIIALERGVLIHQDDRRLRRELQHLVPRRKPLIPAWGRRHPVNRCYGFAQTLGGRVLLALTPVRRGV
jgi:predicted Zn-dependent protease